MKPSLKNKTKQALTPIIGVITTCLILLPLLAFFSFYSSPGRSPSHRSRCSWHQAGHSPLHPRNAPHLHHHLHHDVFVLPLHLPHLLPSSERDSRRDGEEQEVGGHLRFRLEATHLPHSPDRHDFVHCLHLSLLRRHHFAGYPFRVLCCEPSPHSADSFLRQSPP